MSEDATKLFYLITPETQFSPGDRLNFSTSVRGLNFFRGFCENYSVSRLSKNGKIKSVPSLQLNLSFRGNQIILS